MSKLIHLTRKDLGEEVTLDPKFSHLEDYMEADEGICFAPSVEQAYEALPEQVGPGNLAYGYKYKVYHVYTPMGKPKLFKPETDDVAWTGEKRSSIPIKVKKLGKIRITNESPVEYDWL